MNNFLAHILIFQVNEQLKKDIPCYFNENLGFTKSKNESLEEHLESLSFNKAIEYLRDFGYPLNVSKREFQVAKWLLISLTTVYLRTPYQFVNEVYTSLHCVNCGAASQHLSNPLKSNCFMTYFTKILLGSSLPLKQRKVLLVTAFSSGSHCSTFVGGF